MSDVESALVEALKANVGVTSLVAGRIFQQKLAQGSTMPALTYQLIADPSVNSHLGASGLARARIQFDCWGNHKEDAQAVAEAVRLAVVNLKGSFSGIFLQGGKKINEMSMFDPDVRLRRRILDIAIWHSEAQ